MKTLFRIVQTVEYDLEYFIFKEANGKMSIEVVKKKYDGSKESSIEHCIADTEKDALHVAEKLANGFVTPYGLDEVIADMRQCDNHLLCEVAS